jgi:ubiquinone/menaquinone biosynthesis C-methylase UbiE
LQKQIGLTPSWKVADIGSGTGFSAEPFLENGNSVTGVEPNQEMRAAAENLLARWPNFRSIAGTAEATGLSPESTDLITAGQAFHWFNVSRARLEFLRILKPGGWTVLFWNTRRTESTPFSKAYEALLVRYGTDYQQVRHDKLGSEALAKFFRVGYESLTLPNTQILDFDGLKGRLLSSSYIPSPGQPGYEAMMRDLADLFDSVHENGQVRMEYDTEIYFGRL